MSAKGKLKRIALPLLYRANSTAEYSLRIIYNLQFEESNFWFDIYSFISLSLFNKINTWRPTCFIVQTTGFNRPAKFLILLKHWGYDSFELNWFHEFSDTLFPGERRLISLQYSEMLSISLCFHCLSPDMFCTAFSHAKLPRNIHAAREVTLSRF